MNKSYIEFENELNGGFPFVSEEKRNLSYDIPHYHPELEIVYVTEGTLCANCDGETYIADVGEFFIFMPGALHSFSKPQANAIYYAKILPVGEKGSADFLPLRLACPLIRREDALHGILHGAIVSLFEEKRCGAPGYEFAILRYANEILEKILRHGNTELIPGEEQKRLLAKLSLMRAADAFIEENYKEKIDLDTAARACGYSKYYFAHFFVGTIGVSFYSYVTMFRLERALHMMRTGKRSVTEAAYECGFGSVRSFDRAFKKYYSLSPTEYIRLQSAKRDVIE